MKITRDVTTVAGLRRFLASCEVMEVDETAPVFARTGFSLSAADGMPIKRLTVEVPDVPDRSESR